MAFGFGSERALLIFSKQFSAMLVNRLPMFEALENLARDTSNPGFRNVLLDITRMVKEGLDIGEAMASYPKVFNNIYRAVVDAGIQSGDLGRSLEQLVIYLENSQDIRRRVSVATAYPGVILIIYIVTFFVMSVYIIPSFVDLFIDTKIQLPGPTLLVLEIGQFVIGYWWFIATMFGALILLAIFIHGSPYWSYRWHKYKLRLWLYGNIHRHMIFGRFLRTLAIQSLNHIPLLEALSQAANSVGNKYIENLLCQIIDQVKGGMSIGEAFEQHEEFSGLIQQMISSGEEVGELTGLLKSAADYYDSQTKASVDMLISVINPILVVIFGIGTAFLVVAGFLPIFELGKLARIH